MKEAGYLFVQIKITEERYLTKLKGKGDSAISLWQRQFERSVF